MALVDSGEIAGERGSHRCRDGSRDGRCDGPTFGRYRDDRQRGPPGGRADPVSRPRLQWRTVSVGSGEPLGQGLMATVRIRIPTDAE